MNIDLLFYVAHLLLIYIYLISTLTFINSSWLTTIENSPYLLNRTNLVNRVFIFGIDGAGTLFNAEVPTIRNFMKTGIYTLNGTTVMPTISAECWGSMFYSVYPESHALTNDIAENVKMSNPNITSLFNLTRKNFPDAEIYSYAAWKAFNVGMFENSVFNETVAKIKDHKVFERGMNCIKNKNPKLLFLQLDDVDLSGHRYDYATPRYFMALNQSSIRFSLFLEAIKEKNYLDESLIMIVSDHGGKLKDHGLGDEEIIRVFFAASGPGFPENLEIFNYTVLDVAKIAAWSLGMAVPEDWVGNYPKELGNYFIQKQKQLVEKERNDEINFKYGFSKPGSFFKFHL
ncbi:Type I phosphodiesterase/nucleotide pyrophosphatase [Tritrichomonas foetus]|uniref:Type I phosphodiesterase/nucleotide pyrophosphatase n=1 Tax=Tritrichomonas foetus TaxID=1144522 RepID=A0A1J4JR32_9EUKA|nr:Type I phosphodiesterase/nucleotide pyrophosphatase [Tritrichomonas foetus]|eukprot:OHS99973.1 Type I phosphodiesterase/nucleotide pyrophosphatase [Tritrichomonas foetus]